MRLNHINNVVVYSILFSVGESANFAINIQDAVEKGIIRHFDHITDLPSTPWYRVPQNNSNYLSFQKEQYQNAKNCDQSLDGLEYNLNYSTDDNHHPTHYYLNFTSDLNWPQTNGQVLRNIYPTYMGIMGGVRQFCVLRRYLFKSLNSLPDSAFGREWGPYRCSVRKDGSFQKFIALRAGPQRKYKPVMNLVDIRAQAEYFGPHYTKLKLDDELLDPMGKWQNNRPITNYTRNEILEKYNIVKFYNAEHELFNDNSRFRLVGKDMMEIGGHSGRMWEVDLMSPTYTINTGGPIFNSSLFHPFHEFYPWTHTKERQEFMDGIRSLNITNYIETNTTAGKNWPIQGAQSYEGYLYTQPYTIFNIYYPTPPSRRFYHHNWTWANECLNETQSSTALCINSTTDADKLYTYPRIYNPASQDDGLKRQQIPNYITRSFKSGFMRTGALFRFDDDQFSMLDGPGFNRPCCTNSASGYEGYNTFDNIKKSVSYMYTPSFAPFFLARTSFSCTSAKCIEVYEDYWEPKQYFMSYWADAINENDRTNERQITPAEQRLFLTPETLNRQIYLGLESGNGEAQNLSSYFELKDPVTGSFLHSYSNEVQASVLELNVEYIEPELYIYLYKGMYKLLMEKVDYEYHILGQTLYSDVNKWRRMHGWNQPYNAEHGMVFDSSLNRFGWSNNNNFWESPLPAFQRLHYETHWWKLDLNMFFDIAEPWKLKKNGDQKLTTKKPTDVKLLSFNYYELFFELLERTDYFLNKSEGCPSHTDVNEPKWVDKNFTQKPHEFNYEKKASTVVTVEYTCDKMQYKRNKKERKDAKPYMSPYMDYHQAWQFPPYKRFVGRSQGAAQDIFENDPLFQDFEHFAPRFPTIDCSRPVNDGRFWKDEDTQCAFDIIPSDSVQSAYAYNQYYTDSETQRKHTIKNIKKDGDCSTIAVEVAVDCGPDSDDEDDDEITNPYKCDADEFCEDNFWSYQKRCSEKFWDEIYDVLLPKSKNVESIFPKREELT